MFRLYILYFVAVVFVVFFLIIRQGAVALCLSESHFPVLPFSKKPTRSWVDPQGSPFDLWVVDDAHRHHRRLRCRRFFPENLLLLVRRVNTVNSYKQIPVIIFA